MSELHPGARILPFAGKTPRIHPSAFVAPGACLIGDVVIGERASVWYNCVLRADINRIVVRPGSNIQDGTVIHVEGGSADGPDLPVLIGADALIGHMALLHGCTIADGAFVGMGAIAMDGSHVSSGAMLAAGALLPPGKAIGERELWTGRPATFRRNLAAAELRAMAEQTREYSRTAARHAAAVRTTPG